MGMEITKALIAAIEMGVNDLRAMADATAREPEAQADTSVGRIVRGALEERRQAADMLAGWIVRARAEIGLPRNEDA